MISALLSVLAAMVWGAGDFFGGLAARRGALIPVVALSQAAGLVLLLVLAPLFGAVEVRSADLAWGAAGGVASVFGITLLYGALAAGRMSVVAPITAICSIVLPILAGFAFGERLGWAAVVGIAFALVAVVLLGQEAAGAGDEADAGADTGADGAAERRSGGPLALLMALGAGTGIAAFYLCLHQTDDAAGLWPLVATRGVASAVLAGLAVAVVRRRRPDAALPRAALPVAAASGLLDALGNLFYLLAVRDGPLGVVATLVSLYPASTVLLARFLLGERFHRLQAAGLAAALVAIVLIVGG